MCQERTGLTERISPGTTGFISLGRRVRRILLPGIRHRTLCFMTSRAMRLTVGKGLA
jgi:hypothetical protein